MNVYITFDYEIFFGYHHGTLQQSVLYPTKRIIEIGKKHDVKFTFFIDCGYLLKLKEYQTKYPNLAEEYRLVTAQIQELKAEGHDCELHIHPHWEKTSYNGERWVFDYNFYKLSVFSPTEIEDIFNRYIKELTEITGVAPISYRAGGWCIQPFEKMHTSFKKHGLLYDTSVFKGGKNVIEPYYYDYTKAPDKDAWKFEEDVCVEEEKGTFTELPISSYRYSPLFFWRLFILGNTLPHQHKPIGDGKPMPSSITRRKMLTRFHFMSAAVDGYFVSKAPEILKRNYAKGYEHTVLLGHPKAATNYSLVQMDKMIAKYKSEYNFISFSEYHQSQ